MLKSNLICSCHENIISIILSQYVIEQYLLSLGKFTLCGNTAMNHLNQQINEFEYKITVLQLH